MATRTMHDLIQEAFDMSLNAYNCVCNGTFTVFEKIVKAQLNPGFPYVGQPYQMAEPFNGNLETAQILFVGLNPGLTPNEYFPMVSPAHKGPNMFDFFPNRFDPSKGYVLIVSGATTQYYTRINSMPPGVHLLSKTIPSITGSKIYKNSLNEIYLEISGLYYKKVNYGYWHKIKKIADIVLGPGTTPGVDYALTEMVMFKTKNTSNGVLNACISDLKQFFNDVLDTAVNCKYVITLGAQSSKELYDNYLLGKTDLISRKKLGNIGSGSVLFYKVYDVGYSTKILRFVFLPHQALNLGTVASLLHPAPTVVPTLSSTTAPIASSTHIPLKSPKKSSKRSAANLSQKLSDELARLIKEVANRLGVSSAMQLQAKNLFPKTIISPTEKSMVNIVMEMNDKSGSYKVSNISIGPNNHPVKILVHTSTWKDHYRDLKQHVQNNNSSFSSLEKQIVDNIINIAKLL